jgi:hypothetical protein
MRRTRQGIDIYDIIKNHGAYINVYSEEGKGAALPSTCRLLRKKS